MFAQVNWWFKDQNSARSVAELAGAQQRAAAEGPGGEDEGQGREGHRAGLSRVPGKVLVATLRNMERLITAQLGGGREAHLFFRAVADGTLSVEGSGAEAAAGGAEGVCVERRLRWVDTVDKFRRALAMIFTPEQASHAASL